MNDKNFREVFHLIFLEYLFRMSDPHLYILKGGVNLRFFFNSPRFSEDMDLDTLGGSVSTLKKNGYKILSSPAFKRALATYGIIDLIVNDPSKAKQTETTQRFKLHLITVTNEKLPTKVEFSRRVEKNKNEIDFLDEEILPTLTGFYKKLSFRCRHYSGKSAVIQKINALAGRPVTQARDVFDLYILYLGNHFDSKSWKIDRKILIKATENNQRITYAQYRDQVEEYLSLDGKLYYGGQEHWHKIQQLISRELLQ